ncbi:MAG: copper resistance protein B [Desulfurivibrionaceae bacterium]
MKKILVAALLILFPAAVFASSSTPQEGGDLSSEDKNIRKYSRAAPPGDFQSSPVHDNQIFYTFNADRLEYQAREGDDIIVWDVRAWIGNDYNKIALESEGEKIADRDEIEESVLEIFYNRNIHSFWDLQVGLRHDFEPGPSRSFAALGLEGMAPYWFEIDATAYLSEDGDISAALEAEYDILLTQRLILQPRLEIGMAVQEVEERNIGSGINDLVLGARLRYEISRKLAPYIGVSYMRKIGETENLIEAEGGDVDKTSLVAGLKFWF